jgi:putative transposase
MAFVTKYRRKTLVPALLDALRNALTEILADWRCTVIECGGEADHVHRLAGIHPALNRSTLINHLQSSSSRRMRSRFADHLATFSWKPYFWHRAYYVESAGEASVETVAQGTKEKPRKAAKRPSPA